MSMPNKEFFQINIIVLLDKVCNIIKVFKIQGTCCYDITVTFISSPKDDLLEFVKLEFGTFLVFPAFEKEMVTFSVKIP